MASVSYSDLYGRVRGRVEAVTGFKLGLVPMNQNTDPNTLGDKRYSVEFGTSNTGTFRDKATSSARIEHDVVIRFLRRLPPKQQNTRYTEALDNEVDIIQSMMAQSGAWQYDLRVLYVSSGREVLAGGEWLLFTLHFSIAHDLALA